MGQQQSKDELLYEQVSYGNVDGIKALHSEGAKLEYMDREGKTPLIAACLNPALHHVVKTLVELGANVNAYRPGHNGGTPLHHAAKRGLEKNVNLLLSHGANALLVNDDCQTPLDLARAKGFTNVVRAIEGHICLYSGWLREQYGPGFLEILAPQFLSRKVWAVVLPSGSRNLRKPFKLELAIYTSMQDAQPRMNVPLWKASMEEPTFDQPDPAVIISEPSTKAHIKLVPVNERDKPQLQQFCNACKGIPQVVHSNFPFNNATPIIPTSPATAPPAPPPPDKMSLVEEDVELAMAINASLQSAIQQGLLLDNFQTSNGASSSLSTVPPPSKEAESSATLAIMNDVNHTPVPTPSAPMATDEDDVLPDGPIHYPTIESSPVETLGPMGPMGDTNGDRSKKAESSCVICFDAPVEAACVPCGHMGGCMSCLTEIKAKGWGCPVCRAVIDQVIKVYTV
ncbi:putative E3 ubiquitin-protein ligase XBAT35 [Silene latifolia]|uniref:putative E3 ubiquitin-protein ligase XBAT35 n=1 Tax=Silene latifolia TaxID=37657 RepID=UPI003D775F67